MSMPGHRQRMLDRRSGGWPANGVAMHGGDVAKSGLPCRRRNGVDVRRASGLSRLSDLDVASAVTLLPCWPLRTTSRWSLQLSGDLA
jgi:hypothetical protein